MSERIVASIESNQRRRISTDLWGVFFEDISYSADGGLNADLVQNGAFEYNRADKPVWSAFTAWSKEQPASDAAYATFAITTNGSVAEENPHHAIVETFGDADALREHPAALVNLGWDGMALKPGETYHVSLWARAAGETAKPIEVILQGDDGNRLASTTLPAPAGAWAKLEGELAMPSDDASPVSQGTLKLAFGEPGIVHIDFVTLEPATTYRGLKHFRADLVEALADLKPRFMRFPGGCITHGLGLDNMYHWDRTIGPVEHRPHNFNVWGYHQSFRIGYYEYLLLCEAIGAKPVPILPAGVSCQNTNQGPVAIPLEDMPAYIDEVIGLIEFCNGDPATSKWAARRAELGHPEPFGLEYLGIGNEDYIDAQFRDRFERIWEAVKSTHPEITVIGTVGPAPAGKDYEEGWAYARRAGLPIVDEHSYQSPSWWFHNLDHYDDADREGPKVYLGEYGSWDSRLINGLAEAAFMGAMERNGDVVHMASYAPLYAKNGHHSWDPDLIYFDNERTYLPYSYWVQRMFANTTCDTAWPVALDGPTTITRDLPDTLGLVFAGEPRADITDIVVTTDDGERVELPDVHHAGGAVIDTGLALRAEGYTVSMRVAYHEGMWGLSVRTGDVHGHDYNVLELGRGHSLQLVRDGGGYAIASIDPSMDAVRPGTTWDVELTVSNRGTHMELAVDGKPLLSGAETVEEPRRTVAVARDGRSGKDYIRVVNATERPVEVDLAQVLGELGHGVGADTSMPAKATTLTADDPYAGGLGVASPTVPVVSDIDLASGVYTAPAWSFAILEIRGAKE